MNPGERCDAVTTPAIYDKIIKGFIMGTLTAAGCIYIGAALLSFLWILLVFGFTLLVPTYNLYRYFTHRSTQGWIQVSIFLMSLWGGIIGCFALPMSWTIQGCAALVLGLLLAIHLHFSMMRQEDALMKIISSEEPGPL